MDIVAMNNQLHIQNFDIIMSLRRFEIFCTCCPEICLTVQQRQINEDWYNM
jgi:hypothetical protein